MASTASIKSEPTKIYLEIGLKRFGTIGHNVKRFNSFLIFSMYFKFIISNKKRAITFELLASLAYMRNKDELGYVF